MAVWVAVGAGVVALASAAYAVIATSKTTNIGSHPEYDGVSIQTSAYGYVVPVIFGTNRVSGNLIWAGDFYAKKHHTSTGKGGGGANTTSYTYRISFAMGICEGEIEGVGKMWIDKLIYDSVIEGGTIFTGGSDQAFWSYLDANHPDEAMIYSDFAYFAISEYDMGASNYLPNFNYEVMGLDIVDGLNDANPADIITEIITNEKFGLALSLDCIDVDDYSDYCMAADLLLSPAYTSQSQACECIKILCGATNSEIVLHDGSVLKVIPYGDTEITGNGVTWTPNLTVQYDLTDDDFLHDVNEDPITISRKTPADTFNKVSVEYKNRENDYNVDTVEDQDQGYIDLYGLRTDETASIYAITEKSRAQTVANLLLKRNLYVMNTYEFDLGWQYCRLEPMDIVSITDTVLALDQYPVRIKAIEENENGDFHVTAEDMPSGMGTPMIYGSQDALGYDTDANNDPGDVNTPVIFDAPAGLLSGSDPEVWCALSGGDDWGGCDVYVSIDGTNYKYIGRQLGAARYGVLTDDFASGSSPDFINECDVNLTISKGVLLSGTEDDADLFVTLCKVDDELFSYKTAELTSTYNYTLKDYLRRGAYSTTIASHSTGATFVRLDDLIFKYAYSSSYSGKTIYIKFASFNYYNACVQDLADVTAYTHTLP